ncbi:MAG TPA: hypothetical protein VGO37_19030 [Steroidobacteraceae bacterium]|nr:hypothetical protein [Steroidobacteraceae bacterium]
MKSAFPIARPAGTLMVAPDPIMTPAGLTNQKFAPAIDEAKLPLMVVGCSPFGEPTPVTRETTLASNTLVEFVKSASSPPAMLNVAKLSNKFLPVR